jgi:hypothetical protein
MGSTTSAGAVIGNCAFYGNVALVYGSTSSPVVIGGGIRREAPGVIISNTTFLKNQANGSSTGGTIAAGGGVAFDSGTLQLKYVTLRNNGATVWKGSSYSYAQGGALRVNAGNLKVSFCVLSGNTAYSATATYGGALWLYWPSLSVRASINNTIISENSATVGAGTSASLRSEAVATLLRLVVLRRYSSCAIRPLSAMQPTGRVPHFLVPQVLTGVAYMWARASI